MQSNIEILMPRQIPRASLMSSKRNIFSKVKDVMLTDEHNIISKEDGKFPGGVYNEKTGIYWKSNSGYNGPVVCEHIGLNFALIQSGYRLFINPNIMYYRGV